MQRLEFKLSNRKGFTLILSALLIFVFIGAAVMAVDVGHMQLRRADVHAASDAAALAGIEEYAADRAMPISALLEAQAFAGKFKADSTTLTLAAGGLQPWASGTEPTFTRGLAPDTNAARGDGSVHRHPHVRSGAVRTHFARTSRPRRRSPSASLQSVTQVDVCRAGGDVVSVDMLSQLGLAPGLGDTLDAGGHRFARQGWLVGWPITFDIPNGTQVNLAGPGEFYQVNVPPRETAGGT